MAYDKSLIRTTVALPRETRQKAEDIRKEQEFHSFAAFVKALIDRAIERHERAKGA